MRREKKGGHRRKFRNTGSVVNLRFQENRKFLVNLFEEVLKTIPIRERGEESPASLLCQDRTMTYLEKHRHTRIYTEIFFVILDFEKSFL